MVKIVNADYKILGQVDGLAMLKNIELVARTCYKSEDKITEDGESAKKMIGNLVRSGHHAMIEHASISVCFTTDRGVSHEFVRHRVASFAQESTRYCMYANAKFGNELAVIAPPMLAQGDAGYSNWLAAMLYCESSYLAMAEEGLKPDVCRMVLPNSLKTEINITANLREWRHIFELRCSLHAHPSIRTLCRALLVEFKRIVPIIFDDIEPEEENSEWAAAETARIVAEHC